MDEQDASVLGAEQDGNFADGSLNGSGKVVSSRHTGRNPVRAIHNFDPDQQVVSSSTASSLASLSGSGGKKGGSPVPMLRKGSPRSSPRTSPLPHRGSSPAHGRSPSPHHYRSPRASPVSGSTWNSSGVVRNKSAFNKVKSSKHKPAPNAFQVQQQLQASSPDQMQLLQTPAQLRHSAGGTAITMSVPTNTNTSASSASGFTTPGNSNLSFNRNSRSPIMVAGFSRHANPHSPRLSSDDEYPDPRSRRQDPTSRDLEFLGSQEDGFSDSDNELNFYGDTPHYRVNEETHGFVPSGKRPSSSSSNTAPFVHELDVLRPKSCSSAINPDSSLTTTPPMPDSYDQVPVSNASISSTSPVARFDGSNISPSDLQSDEVERRGRMNHTQQLRIRSSSWDSLRSRRQHQQNQNISMSANSQILQASQTREQINMKKRQGVQLQIQHYQQELQNDQQLMMGVNDPNMNGSSSTAQRSGPAVPQAELIRALLQQQAAVQGVDSDSLLDQFSLDQVYEMERILNTVKTRLLKERVFGSSSNVSNAANLRDCRTPPKTASRGTTPNSQDFESTLENEFLVQRDSNGYYAPPHPPSRCNSGHCIFDDMDDGVMGSMDDYESNHQFVHDDGMRAPTMKMFKSGDRSSLGYISPSSVGSNCGTPVSVDGDATVEQIVQQINDQVSNLSRSPGNINFISRNRLCNTNPTATKMQCSANYDRIDLVKNSSLGLDPSKGVDCISSPRSAFSRARPAAAASGRPTSASRPIRVGHPNSTPLSARGRSNVLS